MTLLVHIKKTAAFLAVASRALGTRDNVNLGDPVLHRENTSLFVPSYEIWAQFFITAADILNL